MARQRSAKPSTQVRILFEVQKNVMEENLIKENNKSISEFLGWLYQIEGIEVSAFFGGEKMWCDHIRFLEGSFFLRGHNYHESFDKLMPVVEKIEKMDYGFKMCRKVVEIYIDSTKEVILKTKESNRLDSLYKAVVEFIKWYNQQL